MKRLVALLLVLCMAIPSMAFAEEFVLEDDSVILESGDMFGDTFENVPDEEIQLPEEEETVDIILPEDNHIVVKPNVGVEGPDPYRELVLLQPTDLHGQALSPTSVRLSWSPVAFASRYDVLYKNDPAGAYATLASTPDNQVHFVHDTVTPGQVVYYRVQAVNVAYDGDTPVYTYSAASNTMSFITLEAPAYATATGLTNDSIRLNWGAVAGASSYEVEMAPVGTKTYTLVSKDVENNFFDVTGLENGKGYTFRVRAVRTFSNGQTFRSEYSPVATGTCIAKPEVSVYTEGDDAMLSWNACEGATGYDVLRKDGASYELIAELGKVTSYIDADRPVGQVSYYRVIAKRKVGDVMCTSFSSNSAPFCVVAPAVINAVENPDITDPDFGTKQIINWTDAQGNNSVPGASHFLVYAATSMDGIYTEIGVTDKTTFVATDLDPTKTYYYTIRPFRQLVSGQFVSYGPWSNVMSMPAAGVLQLSGLSGYNATLDLDIAGGYTGDVFTWSVNAFGGSGAYTFRWSLVPMGSEGGIVLEDFSEGYTAIPEGKSYLTDSCSITLNDAHISLINDQNYAVQVEVRDSLGAVAVISACGDTRQELTFVGKKPTTKFINVTLRAGDEMVMDHGIYEAAGDEVIWDISNPTNAISVNKETYEVFANSNGYATVLLTPNRFKNDILVAYNFTVGYATLAINNIQPSALEMNNFGMLSWDINYTGGRPDYTLDCKVYRNSVLVSETTHKASNEGLLSVKYQPTEPGSYYLDVTVKSADEQIATKRSAVTKVVRYNPVTVIPNVTTASVGANVTWVASHTGTGNNAAVRRDYTLFRDGSVVASSVGTNDAAFYYTPTVAGSYVLKVVVYEANGTRIEMTSATVTITATPEVSGDGTATVSGTKVALRKGPSTGYGIILRMDKGSAITVVKTQGDWSYVNYKGTLGWMMSKYVKTK